MSPPLQIVPQSVGVCLLLLSLVAGSAQSAVTLCRDPAGRTHFIQFDCPAGTTPVPDDQGRRAPVSVVSTPPLSPEEKRTLVRLEKSLAQDRAARARARKNSARQRAREIREQAAACRQAERRLDELAETRRKGYTAAAEQGLESAEAHWRAVRRASC